MEIFRIFGSIFLKSDEADKTLDKIDKKAQGIGKTFEKIGKGMSEFGKNMSFMVSAPIVGAGGAAIKLASDMEESINKVNVAFKESGKDVLDWSNSTLKSFGIAKGTALDMAALFGDMGTAMGQSPEEASKMSKSLVGLAGDLASFKNIGIEQAQDALKGIFTGEGESLKTLGVIMQDSTLEAYALATGQKKAYDEMTQAEKVALRYAYVMDSTKNAQGDFARTNDGAANQMRIFSESIQELGATFGQLLLPTFTMLTTKINELVQWFGQLSPSTQQIIVVVGLIVAAIGPLVFIIGTLISSFAAISGAVAAISGPVLIAIGILAALVAAGVLLYRNWDKIKEYANKLFTWLGDVFSTIFDTVKNAFTTAINAIKEVVSSTFGFIWDKILKPYYTWLFDTFKLIFDVIATVFDVALALIWTVIETTFNYIKDKILLPVYNWLKDTFSPIFDAVKSAFDTAIEKIKTVISIAWNFIKDNILLPVYNWLKDTFSKIFDSVKTTFTTAIDSIKSTISTAFNYIKDTVIMPVYTWLKDTFSKVFLTVKDALTNAWNGLGDIVSKIWEGIKDTFKGGINNIISFVNGFIKKINSIKITIPKVDIPGVGEFGGQVFGFKVPEIPMLAEGGNIAQAGRVLVGEAGPEFLDLPKGAKVTPLDKGGITININSPHLFNERDADKLGQLIVGRLRTATGLRI